MDWTDTNLWIVDEDGLPAVIECESGGVSGYAILAFTSVDEANRYKYRFAPRIDINFVRQAARKKFQDALIQVDILRAARAFTVNPLPRPMLGMIIDPALPVPVWIPIQDVVTHGRKQRKIKTALDEIDG